MADLRSWVKLMRELGKHESQAGKVNLRLSGSGVKC